MQIQQNNFTPRAAAVTVLNEGIVAETYLDNAKPPVWTWGIGVTNKSGINVLAFKDKPQSLDVILDAYIQVVRATYLPDVLRAFGSYKLSETELAAALSWHYNTGAIGRTDWVKFLLQGKTKAARDFMEDHYLNNGDLQDRRTQEAALFFSGAWPDLNGTALLMPVSKPSYKPSMRNAKRVNIMGSLTEAMK